MAVREKATSSTAEDNWDNRTIQNIHNEKHFKKEFYHAILMVNNVTQKFFIIITQCLFNE